MLFISPVEWTKGKFWPMGSRLRDQQITKRSKCDLKSSDRWSNLFTLAYSILFFDCWQSRSCQLIAIRLKNLDTVFFQLNTLNSYQSLPYLYSGPSLSKFNNTFLFALGTKSFFGCRNQYHLIQLPWIIFLMQNSYFFSLQELIFCNLNYFFPKSLRLCDMLCVCHVLAQTIKQEARLRYRVIPRESRTFSPKS